MIIKKVALGNSEEAFIEDSFSEGLNIIVSDDNNKGKTIIIQSILYTIGNRPIFPSSFDYKSIIIISNLYTIAIYILLYASAMRTS